MSNYTEADVADDTRQLEVTVEAGNFPDMAQDRARIARLKSAALEGAKVPGLVAALYEARENNDWKLAHAILDGKQHPVVALLEAHQSEASALQARVEELEESQHMLTTQLHRAMGDAQKAESERDALRARVVELEREKADAMRLVGIHQAQTEVLIAQVEAAESERDALRARVERVRAIADASKGDSAWASRVLAALSAPPAETTPAPERCPCGHPPDRHWDVGCVDCTCMRSK